ncbi:amidohydrolase family protein [Polaribacter sp.]|nr:amidohydrolase family protein [Polaribacter sp.]MDC1465205.1 amidohydrolase family protein [Polaribacter sp.]
MKIDAHQHFWQYNPQRDRWINEEMSMLKHDFLPENLLPVLQQHQFDGCVAVQADSSEKETTFLLELAEDNAFIKGVVGWLDLCNENIDVRLNHFSKYKKLKGLRHIVQAEPDGFMLQKEFQHGISALEKYDFTYDILIFPHQLEEAIELVSKFSKQKFILNHCAKPYIKDNKINIWKKNLEKLARFKNVACKVSGLTTEANWNSWNQKEIQPYLDVVFKAFENDRLLFGSDWPVSLLAGNYTETVGLIENYIQQFSKTEQQQIIGLNAINWYNLKD